MSNKIKFELEYPIQASPQLLYQYISTPSGLSEWFADNVNSRGELFTFIWLDGNEDQSYFEIRIQVDGITKDVSLMVTDFAEDDEVEETKMLWDNQISDLKQILGSS